MENIVESIYRSCDQNNTNQVSVSSLINFVKPYMPNNLDELVDLQAKLDPNDSNPHVDYEFFQIVMSDWIASIQGGDINNSLAEVPINLSATSNVSGVIDNIQSNNNNTIALTLQEQVDTLKQQLNKALSELELARTQLAACEDQNESLLADLNSRCKVKNKERHDKALCEEIARESEKLEERSLEATKKCEQLERMLATCEKQQEKWMNELAEIESENIRLVKKIEFLEKSKLEDRKSLIELNETLDTKESEVSTLMEIINDLKTEMDEKIYLVNFYMNEHKLLKQKTRELESSLKKSQTVKPFEDNAFNTPKLLRQLEQPLSPMKDTPSSKRFDTSTPQKKFALSTNNSFDSLLSGLEVETTLRMPHKSLKEELAEISSDTDEIERLRRMMKEQEEMNDKMWENMKKLSKENRTLEEYRKCFQRGCSEGKKHAVNDTIKQLTSDLTTLESNLTMQKTANLNVQKKLSSLSRTVFVLSTKHPEKVLVSESTETEDLENAWTVKVEQPPSRRSNYAKQEMKIDRLVEKLEKLEKELSKERNINTKMCTETDTIKRDMEALRKDYHQQTLALQRVESQKSDLVKQLEEWKVATTSMASKIVRLNEEILKLTSEKEDLENRLRASGEQLAAETSITSELAMEKQLLVKTQCQLEAKIKEDVVLQFRLKKQLVDANSFHQSVISQLQEELGQRRSEIIGMIQQNNSYSERISGYNTEVKRAIIHFFDCCKLHINLDLEEYEQKETSESVTSLENQIIALKTNIAIVVSLLEEVCEKQLINKVAATQTSNESFSEDELSFDEDSFATCSNDISCFAEELPEIALPECDSLLDHLQIENVDWRHLSREEMDEKFTNIALPLIVDIGTQKTRNALEKEKFHQLTIKFFSHLNYSMHLLDSKTADLRKVSKIVATHLSMLRDTSEDIFQLAMRYGVHEYEKRTANCWKSVINYIACLKEERLKSPGRCLEVKILPTVSLIEEVLSPPSCACLCRGVVFQKQKVDMPLAMDNQFIC